MQTAAAKDSEASGETATAYDHVRYPGHPFVETHPDQLATLGSLFGMKPARLDFCRVLELGCGEGANLIPLAFQWPESEFVGIDLSAAAIQEGNDFIRRMGLTNIILRCHDIMQIGREFGSFDYIIAHGVYSWVPAAVREKMLSIFRENLSPHGHRLRQLQLLPGMPFARHRAPDHALSRARRSPIRVSGRSKPARVLRFLAEASAENTIYGFELRNQLDRINGIDDRVLFHDDLPRSHRRSISTRWSRPQPRHGLQYSRTRPLRCRTRTAFATGTRRLSEIPEEDIVTREQYMDFVERARLSREPVLSRRGRADTAFRSAQDRRISPRDVRARRGRSG